MTDPEIHTIIAPIVQTATDACCVAAYARYRKSGVDCDTEFRAQIEQAILRAHAALGAEQQRTEQELVAALASLCRKVKPMPDVLAKARAVLKKAGAKG